ncbi:Abscisic stress-ripening protein 2 [Morella rubra]|uniref:Abscisic stress-ripening protein 2 n=1 Tax=Morella rubra TaxID=262757 RepID=A0A6A1UWN7_9ROSI|nr:Abscisic stress-ripening protein 2 [Morella rubra]
MSRQVLVLAMGLPWHVCSWLAGLPSMGIPGLSWFVKGAGAPCLRVCMLIPWHGCGASAARAMGLSCAWAARAVGMSGAPMGVTGAASRNLSSQSWPCKPWSSLRILSVLPATGGACRRVSGLSQIQQTKFQHEKHKAKKDPENSHSHKVAEEIAAVTAVGAGGFAFHEKHEKKEAKEEDEELHGKKHHHLF